MKRPARSEEPTAQGMQQTYANLITLWTCGIRDYHSLLSDYLTANSIFVAAIGFLLARQELQLIFTAVVLILCLFGILMAVQMAIVLGRFSAQNMLWEWRLRGIEKDAHGMSYKLFSDLYRFRSGRETLTDANNHPSQFTPNWATRQHRQWWARREVSFPLFFGIIYALFLVWGIVQLM